MAKMKTDDRLATPTDRAPDSLPHAAIVTHDDIARRAYDLYCARRCEHGHDMEDWIRAESELREADDR